MNTKPTRINRLQGVTGLLVLAAIVIVLNLLFGRVLWRVDLTEDRLYTISPGTQQLLSTLDRDVTLKFFFSRSMEETPIPIRQYAQRVEELLREYALRSNGRIVVETLDPRPDTEVEDWAQRYGLMANPVGPGGTPFYLGLVAVSGAREAVIPVMAPGQEPQLEYHVTRIIHEATRRDTPTIGLLTPLPVMSPPMGMRGMGQTPNWLFVTELQRLYTVRLLPYGADEIPDEIDLLMVIQPRDMPPNVLYAIDQFLVRGGRMMAFLDPWHITNEILSGSQPHEHGGTVESFNRLLNGWGLSMNVQTVLSDSQHTTLLTSQRGQPVHNATWLSLRGDAFNRDEVTTALIDEMMLPGTGYFSGEPVDGLTLTTLIRSSNQSGRVPALAASRSDDGAPQAVTPIDGRRAIAVRLQGLFPSAFAEGRPDFAAEPGELPPHHAQGEEESVIVLVADADLLFDRFAVRAMNIFGQTVFEPLNDNLNFVINMAEQLTGGENLIGLRTRGTFARPFDRVRDLERAAQERWRQEETRLQERMAEVQQLITEMQGTLDPTQQFILSAEQRAELDRFQEELFETRQQLQDVRRNLRSDIEQLGLRIKTIHIALVPLAVGLFGVARGLWRRRTR